MNGDERNNETTPSFSSARQRRYALLKLAHWIQDHFDLGDKPKIHSAKESEVIYAEVLRRIGDYTDHIREGEEREAKRQAIGRVSAVRSSFDADPERVEDHQSAADGGGEE